MARKRIVAAAGLVAVLLVGIIASNPLETNFESFPTGVLEPERNMDHEQEIAYTDVYGLNIGSNANLADWSSGGTGTETDPYILEDYKFLPGYLAGQHIYCLRIIGTTAHFVIRDCLADGVSWDSYEAIQLWGVHNGRIENTIIREGKHGIYLRDSSNIVIYDNDIFNHRQSAIRVFQSSVNITGNTISDFTYNGIWLEKCSNATVQKNVISCNDGNGVFADGRSSTGYPVVGNSRYHDISYNNISGTENAIMLYGQAYLTDYITVSHNRITENTASGISLYGGFADHNTIAHNIVENNTGSYGIYLGTGVDYCDVFDNTLRRNTGYGIYVNDQCHWNEFYDNTIVDSSMDGFLLDSTCANNDVFYNLIISNTGNGVTIGSVSNHNTFESNTVSENVGHGFYLSKSANTNTILNNTVEGNTLDGIVITNPCYNNAIENNTVADNGGPSGYGILVESDAYDNKIIRNVIAESFCGIGLNTTSNNTVRYNNIYNNQIALYLGYSAYNNSIHYNDLFDFNYAQPNSVGIEIEEMAHENVIENNTIGGCPSYGIRTNSTTHNNTIRYNNFIENMLGGTSQGFDNGSDNVYINNFWNDWTSPDSEPDGIVDLPYSLDGIIGNADDFPLALPSGPVGYHYLGQFNVIHPNGGELINDSVIIQWTASTDILSYEIEYTIYYSPDDGETWILIISELDAMQYEWNTTEVSKGNEFLIKVLAYCAAEPSITTNDTSDGVFTLQGHSLTSPVVLSPNGGETIDAINRVSWTAASDSWGHTITYSVSYSSNGGGEWTEIAAGLQNTYYDWNTTLLSEGSNYLIKVVAECSSGLLAEDTSNDAFTILRHILSQPTVTNPSGGETVSGIVAIMWTASIDSHAHNVNYTVFYSADGGESWVIIESDLLSTNIAWNTTELEDGSNYRIKIVATCSESLATEFITGVFTIQNEPITSTTTTDTSTTGTTAITTTGDDSTLMIIGIIGIIGAVVVVVIIVVIRKGIFKQPTASP